MVVIRDVGNGLVNTRKAGPGELKDTLNFYHGRLERGAARAETRKYTKRLNDTKLSAGTGEFLLLHEHRQDDGTDTKVLAKMVNILYSINASGSHTTVKSGLESGTMSDACRGYDKTFIADGDAGSGDNYAYFSLTDCRSLVQAGPTAAIGLAESGTTATNFGTGQFQYSYSDYDSTTGWETTIRNSFYLSASSKTDNNKGITISDSSLAYVAPYNYKRIYRRLRGENSWYLITELIFDGVSTGFPYQDVTVEGDLTINALSEVHDNFTGLADAEVPTAAETCAFYRGFLFLGNMGTNDLDLVRWSKVGLPFLFPGNAFYRKQIGDDGDPVQRLVVFNETLVCFKRNSIWVLRGDTDVRNWVWAPATHSIGLISPYAVVSTPQGVVFLGSDHKAHIFNLGSTAIVSPTLDLLGDTTTAAFNTRVHRHIAGYDPYQNCVYLTIFGESATVNSTYVLFLDGLVWGKFAWKNLPPQAYASLTNANGERKLNFGGSGYVCETETDSSADGINSGTVLGVVTGSTSNTVTCSAASFVTAGSGLSEMTVRVVETGEEKLISSNTGTVITIVGTWTTNPTTSQTVEVQPMDVLLWYGSIDDNDPNTKRINKMFFTFDEGTGKYKFGATTDDEATRTNYSEVTIT